MNISALREPARQPRTPSASGVVNEALLEELVERIEAGVGDYVDPGKRVALGLRLFLHTARAYPSLARFLSTGGMRVIGPASRIHHRLARHIAAERRSARFAEMPTEVALDLVGAASLAAMERFLSGQADDDYPEQVTAAVLRGLGVPGGEALRLVKVPLPALRPTVR